MKKDLLLLVVVVIIAYLVTGTYEDLLEIARQLRAGQIDGAEALDRVVGAMVRLAADILPDWRPIEKEIEKRTDQLLEEVAKPLIGKAIALFR